MRASRLKLWKTKPSVRLRVSASASASSRDTSVAVEPVARPSVGRSRQPRMFISVDLPEPEAPMMATNSPSLDVEGHAAQRVHVDVAHPVGLGDVGDLDERRDRHRRRRVLRRARPCLGLGLGALVLVERVGDDDVPLGELAAAHLDLAAVGHADLDRNRRPAVSSRSAQTAATWRRRRPPRRRAPAPCSPVAARAPAPASGCSLSLSFLCFFAAATADARLGQQLRRRPEAQRRARDAQHALALGVDEGDVGGHPGLAAGGRGCRRR